MLKQAGNTWLVKCIYRWVYLVLSRSRMETI